jgi:hypothetical protein
MVKRAVNKVKKDPKMKQKQRQQQSVTVNIGTVAKKPRAKRQSKPKPQAQAQPSSIVTRGPTTFYQQPQPNVTQSLAQPNINELFKMIQQQAQAKETPQTQAQVSIVPPPPVEAAPKEENDLERIRKSRIKAVEKPELERVFEEHNEDVDLEDQAYQTINKPFKPLSFFYEQLKQEKQTSLLNEPDPVPSINLNPWERIAPDIERPNLSLQESALFAAPKPTLTRSDTDTTDDSTPRQQQNFLDLFSNSPSLEPQGTAQTLLTRITGDGSIIDPTTQPPTPSVSPALTEPPTPRGETFEEEVYEPQFIDDPEPPAEFQPEPEYKEDPKKAITEIKVGQVELPTPPPKKEVYKGGQFLPAIVQPRGEETPLVQLLNPTIEPSLAEAVAAEVRPADQYVTEQLVKDKGLPDAEARVVDIRQPKERLKEFATSLGVDISAGKSGKRVTSEEIRNRIYEKMGDEFEIPSFKEASIKPGPKKGKPAIAEIDV